MGTTGSLPFWLHLPDATRRCRWSWGSPIATSIWLPKVMTWRSVLGHCLTAAWLPASWKRRHCVWWRHPSISRGWEFPIPFPILPSTTACFLSCPVTAVTGGWQFRQGEQEQTFILQGNPVIADDVLGCISLAEQGVGICQTYEFNVAERLRQGRLVRLLEAFEGARRPFSIIYPPHRQLSAAIRALIDFLLRSGSEDTSGSVGQLNPQPIGAPTETPPDHSASSSRPVSSHDSKFPAQGDTHRASRQVVMTCWPRVGFR